MNLDFLKYYNYADRKIKRIDARGPSYLDRVVKTMTDIQFNPNDDVNTEVILEHFSETPLSSEPNYVVAWYTLEGGSVVIDSRWFIMDTKRTRAGQWKVSLRRDVVAEHWDDIKTEPCFVEKGYVPYNNSFIFNDEGVSFNQIKRGEQLITDRTNCPWLVAYVAKYENADADPLVPVNLVGKIPRSKTPDIVLNTPISQWQYYDYFNEYSLFEEDVHELRVGAVTSATSSGTKLIYFFDENGAWTRFLDNEVPNKSDIEVSTGNIYQNLNPIATRMRNAVHSSATNANKEACFSGSNIINANVRQKLLDLNNKIIKDSNNHYYEIKFGVDQMKEWNSVPEANAMFSAINTQISSEISQHYMSQSSSLGQYQYRAQLYGNIAYYYGSLLDKTADFINGQLASAKYNLSGHYNTSDAPYNIIAVPYADGYVRIEGQQGTPISKEVAMEFMTQISAREEVYDVQMLPYCPMGDLYSSETNGYTLWVPDTYKTPAEYTYITMDAVSVPDDKLQVVFNVPYASFYKKIDAGAFKEAIETNSNSRKRKILTEFCRLCSPNYNGIFQFNRQKNNGLEYFDINCTYKPFNPYIHINPNFGGLYGADWNDSRGLVCGGDFSLPVIKNNWVTYQTQNKNFQTLFDRNIEHMETEYSIQNTLAGWNIAGGALSGGMSGAITGMTVAGGNPIGGAVGAVLGTGLSVAGGIADLQYQKQLQQENLQYTKDTFRMQLDNIKAQPNTLARVGTYDIDNKIFPFIELYMATGEEQQALIGKLDWSGMTIGAMGTLAQYINPSASSTFVQGQLVLTNSYTSFDTHIANALYQEIAKGVRIEA